MPRGGHRFIEDNSLNCEVCGFEQAAQEPPSSGFLPSERNPPTPLSALYRPPVGCEGLVREQSGAEVETQPEVSQRLTWRVIVGRRR